MRSILIMIIAGSFITGSATPSQSLPGGYPETALVQDVFRIRLSGNAFSSMDRAQEKTISITSEESNNIRLPSPREALGCKVYTADGNYLGEVVLITNNGYGDQYIVVSEGKSKVNKVDATEESFKEIDLKSKKMIVVNWR